MTSFVSCCARIVNQNKWPTLLHDRADVTVGYIYLSIPYFYLFIFIFNVDSVQFVVKFYCQFSCLFFNFLFYFKIKLEKIYSVSVLLMFFLLKKINCSNIDFFYHSSRKMIRRWKKKNQTSIDKWNNNFRLQEKKFKFSFNNKLKKYSWILNLQGKTKKNPKPFPLINVLIIILDHKT